MQHPDVEEHAIQLAYVGGVETIGNPNGMSACTHGTVFQTARFNTGKGRMQQLLLSLQEQYQFIHWTYSSG